LFAVLVPLSFLIGDKRSRKKGGMRRNEEGRRVEG
jgi:hypothetical protein